MLTGGAIAKSIASGFDSIPEKAQFPMDYLLQLVVLGLSIYSWIIIAAVILSLLVSFGVVSGYRPEVRKLQRFLENLTEPLFYAIRRRLPPMGGLDLSPIVALLGISVLQILIDKIRLGILF